MLSLLRPQLCLTLITATAASAQAQIVLPSDVGVTLTVSPSSNLQPSQPIDMTLTVTNYGPAAVPILDLASSVFVDEMYLVSQNVAECYLFLDVADLPNGTAEYLIDWPLAGLGGVLPPFPPGETTCHFQIALTQSAPSTYSFSFGLPPSYETDPNPTNDVATVTLHRAPSAPATPVPAVSPWMLLLLASLSGWIAAHALTRLSRSRSRHAAGSHVSEGGSVRRYQVGK